MHPQVFTIQESFMKAERIILSFVAVLIGLIVAGGAYYAYEFYFKNQPVKSNPAITVHITPSPTPANPADYLTVDQPADQNVSSDRTITVSGKATKGSTIIISTPSTDEAGITSGDGSYSMTVTLDDDTNPLFVTAVYPDGSEQKIERTVTYSTASF